MKKDVDPETIEILRRAAEEAKKILEDAEEQEHLSRPSIIKKPIRRWWNS